MSRIKTVVFEEVEVFDLTFERWRPWTPREAGDGRYLEATEGSWFETKIRGVARKERNKIMRASKDSPPTVRDVVVKTRKAWKKLSEKITNGGAT